MTNLEEFLPEPSRKQGIAAHRAFGVDDNRASSARIVDLDIAACYEYVDHQVLFDELLMQSLDPVGSRGLVDFLRDLFPRAVGLPQAMSASHLLADVYLQKIVRGLQRSEIEINRFADDFRLIVEDWAGAHHAIELMFEEARSVGLTLAGGKTRIRSIAQLQEEEGKRQALLDAYRKQAADELRSIEFVEVGYDEVEWEEVEAPGEQIDFSALRSIVEDWVESNPEERSAHAAFGAQALRELRGAPERLPDRWLVAIVEREPSRLRNVLDYLRARKEMADNWNTLGLLVSLPRRSSWASVWVLSAAESFDQDLMSQEAFQRWARERVSDSSEVVRAEAAWTLTRMEAIDREELANLYVGATDITRLGVSAAVGRLDKGSPSKLGKAVAGTSKLARSAYEWGAQYEN